MATKDSRNGQERYQRERDLFVIMLILLLGLSCLPCLLGAADLAIRPSSLQRVAATRLSRVNADERLTRGAEGVYVQPLRPEVMTPVSMDQVLATQLSSPVPAMVIGQPPSSTGTPHVAAVPTSPSGTEPARDTPTPHSTPTSSPQPTDTPEPTATPSVPATQTPATTATGTPVPPPPTDTPEPPPPPATPEPPSPTDTPQPPAPTDTPAPPVPVVQAITPDTRVNTALVDVMITGQDFQPGCSVSLDSPTFGTFALTITNNCALSTTILAQVPVDVPLGALPAGFYDLIVTNPDSQWGTLGNAYTSTNPFPTVTSMTPAVTALDGTVMVTIDGNDLRSVGAPGGLRAEINGIPLTNVTYVGTTQLTATAPRDTLGIYTLVVINPGPTDPSGSLAEAFTVYTYTTEVTCGAGVSNCSNSEGEPDGQAAELDAGEVITMDLGTAGINNGSGYDMVFYEWPNGPGIQVDYVIIEISDDGATWYTVFAWDGIAGGVSGTNIDTHAIDGEDDNETIWSADLYPGGLPLNTGIAIDIGTAQPPLPHDGPFRWVRVYAPPGSGDPAQIDAIVRLH